MPDRDDDNDIDEDRLLDILSNRRRRYILYILQNQGAMEVPKLTEEVASIEQNKKVEDLSASEYKRMYVILLEFYLPELDEAGLIDFDDERKFVEATDKLPNLRFQLEINKVYPISFELAQRIIALTTFVLVIGSVSPGWFGYTVNTVPLALVMPLITIALGLVYYLERSTGPNIQGVSIEGVEEND